MIQAKRITDANEVVRLRMARTLLGQPLYHTAAYWVDGLLIDSGCAHTARQLTSTLKGWHVTRGSERTKPLARTRA